MIELLNGIHETINFDQNFGFRLYDNADQEEYPAHWHSELEIIMPLHNIYTVNISRQTYVLREGDILIIASGVLHHLPEQEGERIILQPAFSLLRHMQALETVLSLIAPTLLITPENNPEIYDRLRLLILEMKEEYFAQSPLAEAAIYYRLIEMFVLIGRNYNGTSENSAAESGRKKKEYTEKLLHVCNYINNHCTEDLNLEAVANLAGFSKYHFTRLFKSFSGMTFYRYLNQQRISQAEKLLVDPELPITEVALRCGFNNLSTFIRMFKIIKGCTPTEFRNMYNY